MTPPIRWALLASLALVACDKSNESAKPDEAKASASEAPAPEARKPDGEGTIYAVSLKEAGVYKVGEPAKVEAVLEAMGGYKCNKDYPYKFRLEDPPEGVEFEKKVVKGIDRKDERSVMTIPFKPTSAGEKEIAGTFYFSVCDDETCKIDKKKMSIKINVGES